MFSPFTRRGPDIVTEELADVLSTGEAFEFKPLFDVVHLNLKSRNAASGGEEMLRLRAYEKLQTLVQRGFVTKTSKLYQGVAVALARFKADAAETRAKTQMGGHLRSPKGKEAPAARTSVNRLEKTKHGQAQLPVRETKKRR
jgi:hypothetical protein